MPATSFTCDAKSCYGSTDNDRMVFAQVQAVANQLATRLGLALSFLVKPDGAIGEPTRDLVRGIAFASEHLPLSGLREITQKQIAENAPQLIAAMMQQLQSPQPTPGAGARPPSAPDPTAGTHIQVAAAPPLVFTNNGATVNPGNVVTSATTAIMSQKGGLALAIGGGVLLIGVVAAVLVSQRSKSKQGVSGADWNDNIQKAYRAQKAALTRAQKAGPEAVLKAVREFESFYESRGIALPDDWHRWERAKEDAQQTLRSQGWTPRQYTDDDDSGVSGPTLKRGKWHHAKTKNPTRKEFLAWYHDILNTSDGEIFSHQIDDLVSRAGWEMDEKPGAAPKYWRVTGDAVQEAWETIGGKGKVTIAKLRALPRSGRSLSS